VFAQAQSRKDEFNIYREVGLTARNNAYGLHYSWQAQISKTFYLGMAAEAIRLTVAEKEMAAHKENLAPVTFRISNMAELDGLRLVPYFGAGVVLPQNGTVLEGGLGVAAGRWQLSAAYCRFGNSTELPKYNGVFLRLSRLLIREATRPHFQ
jgi:hypothetical protein